MKIMDTEFKEFFSRFVKERNFQASDLLMVSLQVYGIHGPEISADDFFEVLPEVADGYDADMISPDSVAFHELANEIARERGLEPWEIVLLARKCLHQSGGFSNATWSEMLVQFRIEAAFREAKRLHPEWIPERMLWNGPADRVEYCEQTS